MRKGCAQISFLVLSGSQNGFQIWHLLGSFLGWFFEPLLVTFWNTFGDHFGTHFRTRASKTKKATFSKKWFSWGTVCIFSLLRPPKELLNPKKRDPKLTQKLTSFEPILGSKWGQTGIQKLLQKGRKSQPIFTNVFMDVKIIERINIIFWCPSTPL